MILISFVMIFRFTRWVSPLRSGLHGFLGAWRRCNSLEWNDHSASLRLAMYTIFHGLQAIESRSPLVGHLKDRTLHPVQLRFLG